jgi:hypothetical protein
VKVKKKKIKTLALVVCALAFVGSVSAQSQCVRIKFEVDGKQVDQKFRVLLSVDNKVIEPTVVGKSFIVPPELKDQEKVNVRFLSGQYDLSFESVYLTKFNTDWIVGIDTPPFDSENIASENPDPPGKTLSVIWYIDFVPKDKGDGTRVVVKVYK